MGFVEQMAYNPQQNGYYAAPPPNAYVPLRNRTKNISRNRTKNMSVLNRG
jgi:hypothetical protein